MSSTTVAEARPKTTEESAYRRAQFANLPGGAFFEGQWQTAELTLEVRDPEDGVLLGRVCTSTSQDVERAIAHIDRHLQADEWPLRARRQALEKAVLLLGEQAERFANIIASESSKTITEAEREVKRCIETLRLSAAASEELAGETLGFEDSMAGAGKIGWYSRQPVGIVAAITPFNDPLNLVAHKLGPALIGGNGVVLKPSTRTPLTGLAFVRLLLDAGVPSGRIAAIVSGPGVSEAVVTDPRVDLISFTGGPATAERIAAAAGAKKILSELGGNNATIVCSDADAKAAAKAIVAGAFGVAGQNCLSVQRVYVHTSLFDEVLDLVTAGTKALRIGPKLDRGTDVGPLISEAEARRVEEWVEEAKAAGATVHAGGKRHNAYYEPTVLADVPSDAKVIAEEVFGPVVSILPFIEVRDAVFAANNTEYGLQAGIFTQSRRPARGPGNDRKPRTPSSTLASPYQRRPRPAGRHPGADSRAKLRLDSRWPATGLACLMPLGDNLPDRFPILDDGICYNLLREYGVTRVKRINYILVLCFERIWILIFVIFNRKHKHEVPQFGYQLLIEGPQLLASEQSDNCAVNRKVLLDNFERVSALQNRAEILHGGVNLVHGRAFGDAACGRGFEMVTSVVDIHDLGVGRIPNDGALIGAVANETARLNYADRFTNSVPRKS